MLFEYSRRTISVSKVISGAVTKKKHYPHVEIIKNVRSKYKKMLLNKRPNVKVYTQWSDAVKKAMSPSPKSTNVA